MTETLTEISSTPTDRELVQSLAADRNGPAFGCIVQRYANMICASARRQVGDWSAAEDVTQAVFLALWKKAQTLRDGSALAGWLLSAARLAARDSLKRQTARQKYERGAAMNPRSESIDQDALAANLDEALSHLRADDRTAVALRYLGNRPFAEVAVTLGISEDAAKKRVARALGRLRKALARQGVSGPNDLLEAGLLGIAAAPVGSPNLAQQILSAYKGGAGPAASASSQGLLHLIAVAKLKAAALMLGAVAASVITAGLISWCLLNKATSVWAAAPAPAAPVDQVAVWNEMLKASAHGNGSRGISEGGSGEYFVGGYVHQSGVYSLMGREVTLKEAIGIAGGIDPIDANDAYVEVIKRTAPEHISRYALKDIMDDKVTPATIGTNTMIMVGPSRFVNAKK